MLTVLFLVEKIKREKLFFKSASLHFSHVWKICILKKTSNGSSFGWLIRQMSINQKSGRQTFRRRFVSGSLFVSPCPPECYLQSETKIEPDLRLFWNNRGQNSLGERGGIRFYLPLPEESLRKYGDVITKFSRMDSLPNFLSYRATPAPARVGYLYS